MRLLLNRLFCLLYGTIDIWSLKVSAGSFLPGYAYRIRKNQE